MVCWNLRCNVFPLKAIVIDDKHNLSARQQNLPVTIKYPEMVAQIAPHFTGNDIPPYGKDNLWFL